MKDFLQGKWLKHPLHPILVHVPTSVWPAALVLDVLVWLGLGVGRGAQTAAYWCILFGLVAALGAIPTGLADYADIRPEKPAKQLGLYHMMINLTVSVLFLVNLLLRLGNARTDWYHVLLSALGVALLSVSGYLGGRMVYEHGIGIGRTSKKKWKKIAEEGKARVPSEKGGEA